MGQIKKKSKVKIDNKNIGDSFLELQKTNIKKL